MVTQKCFWKDEEIVVFDRGKTENGAQRFRFYRKSNIPEDAPWPIIDEPDNDILRTIAFLSGENVVRQWYVTPPDTPDFMMGTYVFLPTGGCIHFDPEIPSDFMEFFADNQDLFFERCVGSDLHTQE